MECAFLKHLEKRFRTYAKISKVAIVKSNFYNLDNMNACHASCIHHPATSFPISFGLLDIVLLPDARLTAIF